jgi:predicted Zn-dependent protease
MPNVGSFLPWVTARLCTCLTLCRQDRVMDRAFPPFVAPARRCGWRPALRAAVAAGLLVAAAMPPWRAVQAQPPGSVLPALGDSASEEFSVAAERQLGDRIMREARRDPELLDDPLLQEYLESLWRPLVAAARARGDVSDEIQAHFAWEAFLVRDRTVNAFALPGGYMGMHLGLISITNSRDELASVLAHELSHITQRHIARSVASGRRASMIGMASLILGIMAAARSPEAAHALLATGQAASMQGQLNFSRDMEREADRVGSGVLALAGFSPAGMPSMFEKLQQANRLNDFNQFPYLRTHPLTTERIGEARARLGVAEVSRRPANEADSRMLHAVMRGRARALMDSRGETQQRLAAGALGGPANGEPLGDAEALTQACAGALAAMRMGQWTVADGGVARALGLASTHPAALRAVKVLQIEGLVARGQAAQALGLLGLGDGSRVNVLLAAQAALGTGAPPAAAQRSRESLQTWVALHPADASAWTLLGRLYERADQTLPAVRAQAEAQLALGDVRGAVERLRAGQNLARRSTGQAESIEAAIIDARLKDVEQLSRRLNAEARDAQRTE